MFIGRKKKLMKGYFHQVHPTTFVMSITSVNSKNKRKKLQYFIEHCCFPFFYQVYYDNILEPLILSTFQTLPEGDT